jgi:hypothetical protein
MKIKFIIFVFLITSYLLYANKNENIFVNIDTFQLNNQIYDQKKYCITYYNHSDCDSRKYIIKKNSKTIAEILIPQEGECSDLSNLALNGIMEDKKGFQLSIEYGSRFFYNKIFYFKYHNDSFYLYQIQTKSFDKANPEKWKTKNKVINPKIKITNFNLEQYLIVDNMDLK